MSELTVQSHQGPYKVRFVDDKLSGMFAQRPESVHFLVDDKVARIFSADLSAVLRSVSVLRIEAAEINKSLEKIPGYIESLVAHQVRRGDALIAIGGGIVQDIACFLAATLLRGLEWRFYPTTLLAQADSCIGSKSSINVGTAKNILGTFTPPREVTINPRFLDTLEPKDIRSGIGEMLKVHIIDGPQSFDRIAADYHALFQDQSVMLRYIRSSLEIKKAIIEKDEFDSGIRNVMNYGHTFGHAIESATDFAIPHGIAVSIGMDMANFTAARLGLMSENHYRRMRPILAANFADYEQHPIALEPFLAAITKDKKNTKDKLGLIVPDRSARVGRHFCSNDETFRAICKDYLNDGLRARQRA